jgi:Heterokaryon incompatibility protein (HET)
MKLEDSSGLQHQPRRNLTEQPPLFPHHPNHRIMRLLNIKTLKLEWFHNAEVAPSYVILSHRWEDQEVLFEDVNEKPEDQAMKSLQKKLEEMEQRLDALHRRIGGEPDALAPASGNDHPSAMPYVHASQAIKPKGWAKVLGCCKIAEQFGISYVWIDTCCIDKNSSAELSESLNSMFAWYRNAALCIAYLSDATLNWGETPYRGPRPERSTWFRRGWTLQELIAPTDIWFYKGDWTFLGIRSELAKEICKITGIQETILERNGLENLPSISVAARMSC